MVHFLRGAVHFSATLVKALKQSEDGMVLNGVWTRTIDRLHTGDLLEITLREDVSGRYQTGSKEFYERSLDEPSLSAFCKEAELLYEDDDVMVFNKPVGMPSHPSHGHQDDSLASVFAALCAGRGEARVFRAVNRLDRDTTGAMLVAKNAYAAAALAGHTEKVYLAVTSHPPQPLEGEICGPIGQPDPRHTRRVVMEGGQAAQTVYKTLAVFPESGCALVRCTLPTGRTHQIRVHMAWKGWPLAGDPLYGQGKPGERQLLHCARVSFLHPVSGKQVTVDAPPPKDMQNFCQNCAKSW